jgi:hypothetical protein
MHSWEPIGTAPVGDNSAEGALTGLCGLALAPCMPPIRVLHTEPYGSV